MALTQKMIDPSAYCRNHQSDNPDDSSSKHSETSVNFYETTRRNITEDCHFHEIVCWLGNFGTNLRNQQIAQCQ
jgi:hypothetical protein